MDDELADAVPPLHDAGSARDREPPMQFGDVALTDVGGGSSVWGWSRVPAAADGPNAPPCQRSLHVAAVLKDKMLVFGGYDGSNR